MSRNWFVLQIWITVYEGGGTSEVKSMKIEKSDDK